MDFHLFLGGFGGFWGLGGFWASFSSSFVFLLSSFVSLSVFVC